METAVVSEYETLYRLPTVAEYQNLRTLIGWDALTDATVLKGLSHSVYSVILKHEGKTVACGRITGDGAIYYYLQDVLVHPDYQGIGVGKKLMDELMTYLHKNCETNAFIGCMATPGVEGFYEKYGFTRRPENRPGMYRIMD